MTQSKGIRERSYAFALRVVRLARSLRRDSVSSVIIRQVLRSGTSIGANVEEAQAAQTKRDFVHKMSIARKEAHETLYWMRLLHDSEIATEEQMSAIIDESHQLLRLLTAIVKTSQLNQESIEKTRTGN